MHIIFPFGRRILLVYHPQSNQRCIRRNSWLCNKMRYSHYLP